MQKQEMVREMKGGGERESWRKTELGGQMYVQYNESRVLCVTMAAKQDRSTVVLFVPAYC